MELHWIFCMIIQITSIDQGSILTGSGKAVLNPVNNSLNQDGNLSYALLFSGNTTGVNVDANGGSIFIIHAKALKAGSINLNTVSDNSVLVLSGNNARLQLSDSNGDAISFTAATNTITISDINNIPISNFVTRFYQLCLGRTPDSEGLNYWVNGLLNKTYTGADVAYYFITSPEFTNMNAGDEEFINVMYKAFFNRGPDSSGKAYWLDRLVSGDSRLFVLSSFVNSPEFNTICSNYGINRGTIILTKPADIYPNITEFVYRLYVKCLQRKPDDTGLNYYVGELAVGRMTGLNTAYHFIFCPEFEGRSLSNTDFITIMYRVFFNREPDAAGAAYHISNLNAGGTRLNEFYIFVNSAEFANVCSTYGIKVK